MDPPAEEIDVEEDVLAVVEVQLGGFDHDLANRLRRGAQNDDWKQIQHGVV